MAEELAACARQLFEGAPGSGEQRAANAWLMQFQRREEAWQATLQLLETPARDPRTQQPLAAPELVAVQILRLKTQHEWARISAQQQQGVRQTLLKLLEVTCMAEGGVSTVSCRIACVTLADIVVKSCRTWTGWKSDVQRLVDAGIAAQRQQKGAAVLVEILGAIPLQILASERLWSAEETHEMLTLFQEEAEDVMTAVQTVLANLPNERSSALRCLEGWIVGCVPTHEAFGLTAAQLFSRGMIDMLFNIVISDNEEQAQLAAGIIADSFVYTVSEPVPESMANAVLHSGRRLVEALPVFQSEVRSPTGEIMMKEQQTTACRGISRIACSLAMNHAPILLSNQLAGGQTSFGNRTPEQQSSLSVGILELLLACSSYDDIDVVQPTLEIWFFFLEDTSSQNEVSWQLLDAAGQDHVVSVLSRLVNALIERCKFPQWFVERQQIGSDDPEIEAISDLRREIADTMLSLFSKWPGGPGKPTGDYASCVKGMCQMLSVGKDVALVDALLYLLSYMVELFDAISSDSESEDDPEAFHDPASGGIDVLLGALDCALNLPTHPLVINGIARYLRSLSASLALPASVYLRASMILCQGLQYTSSYPVTVQSLLQNSASIIKYTTVEERAPLLQTLLRFCSTLQTKTTQESEGGLLEVTLRFASGVSDADFAALCSSVLSDLTVRVQSANPTEASSSVYMLGRALGGVQDQQQGRALVDQLWPVVSASLLQHTSDDACRHAGVQFFLNVISHLHKEGAHPIEAQILEVCLWWYGEGLSPDILTCCSRLIARQRNNADFQTSAEHVFERLLVGFRSKLHDVPGTGSDSGELSMESFLTQHREADKMIPEVEQFMRLAREVLTSFPQVLLKNRSNGGPTLYWVCLDLATRLVQVDHQMQEMCDAACDFLLDAMRCQPEPILERISIFATEVMRVVLSFLGSRREHYRVRNLWDFLFQCLHAPQMPTPIRGKFGLLVSLEFACQVV
ncbi:hypothetical protein PHYPSEUDO_009625 [Phytophthora pseudosyringae]|uniref:Importin N-terminal domain-containing protein n=1 Tax=Phytophthora pseudosyringae TaxID=221518 RepID=A0A8T1WJP5_9STRA|nr:hypothetical protein PHYPSEUDO_009625 [Phytophthora pseudosyringae]